jgi:hypothetical protein
VPTPRVERSGRKYSGKSKWLENVETSVFINLMRIRKKGGTQRVKRSGVVGDAKYPLCGATEGSETRIGLVGKLIQDLSPQSIIS